MFRANASVRRGLLLRLLLDGLALDGQIVRRGRAAAEEVCAGDAQRDECHRGRNDDARQVAQATGRVELVSITVFYNVIVYNLLL